MKHDMIRHITDKIARAKEGLRHTLSILFEYAWSMARVCLEYAKSMPRVWVEYASTLLSGGQKLCADEITSRPLRDYGSLLTRLRFVVSLLLMMFVGVGEVWGQEGIWYIANSSRGNAAADEYTYDASSPENNYYLVPAADPKQTNKQDAYYSENYSSTAGDPERPFITTYKTAMDNNSIWLISPSGDGFYYIIHAATGKYLIYEPPHSGATNRKSMHLQTVDNGKYSLSTNNDFKFKFEPSTNGYTIRPYSFSNATSGNRFFNVANKNFNCYYGNSAKNPNYYHDGLVGLYSSGHEWVLKDASDAAFVKPVISDVDVSTSTFTISFPTVSITYPYTTPLTEDIKALGITSIIYTTNGDEPTVGGATTKTYSSAVWLGESCTVMARGVYGNGSMTPVVSKSFENIPAVCALPTFTYNHTDKTVTITSLGPTDATFYYTLNGVDPTATVSETNFQYADNPIAIPDNCNVVKAIAVKDGYANSNVSSISRVEAPTFGSDSQGITISSATEGASIFYTTDGSDPTTDSTPYDGAINLPSGTTIKAIAVKDGYIHSSIVSFTSLLPTEIRYDAANNKVVITNATDGATIYYTTGATESDTPDPNGSEKIEYTYGNSGFELEDNVNFIKAIAVKGSDMSPEAQLAIVIHASTAGADRPYLIQSVECTDFYMIPGDKANNIFYLNTSSLGSASMEWCFYYAGNEGGVDYYFIKNNNFTSNPYLRYADDRISMQTTATFNAANETDKKAYWFSIVYANTTSNPGYYIHPYNNATVGNGLCKSKGNNANEKGNNVTNVVNLADATNTANSNARWNFIPSANKDMTLPFTAWGDGGVYKYYKIKKEATSTDATNYLLPRTETVSYAIATTASNVSGSANSILWHFDKDALSSDEWVSYYYIVNAATGEYLYFNGNKTAATNENAFEVKEELVESEKDRYLFAFVKSTTANFCYILPKALQQVWKKNDYHLIYWDNTANNKEAPLMTAENRASDLGKWTFEEVAVTGICPPKVSLDPAGNVKLTSRTRDAVVEYTVDGGSEQTFNGSTDPVTTLPSEGGQVVITTKTSLVGDPVEESITVVYKPTIVFAPEQSIVYNGQTHAPELSSVTMGTTELKDHCVVSSDDINSGNATAVITQIEDDPNYVIYGTAPFTIEKSPLTIYADSKVIEYGEERPELTFSTFGLASSDVVEVNLSCAPGTEIGNYPITFDGTYTITRQVDGTNAIPNYKDITLVASSLIITGKSLGDGVHFAEGITAEVTPSGDSYNVSVMRNMASIGSDNYEVTSPDTKGYYNDKIWTITGKGHYAGSAKFAFIQSDFTERDGEYRAAYVASYDWAIPEGSNIEAWIATTVNPSVNVLQVKPVDYLPAGVPVVLTATVDKSGGFVVYPKSNETVDITNSQKEDNKLKVVTAENGITVNDREKYVYSKGEFVLAYGGLLSQGKIYIDRPANVSGARLRIVKDNDVTGISDVSEDNKTWIFDDIWYSLDGRKLSGKPSQKGIYINNGRKIVVN